MNKDNTQKLTPHPRLYVSRERLARLASSPASPLLRTTSGTVQKQADDFVRTADFAWPPDTHNAHLIRAQLAQTRLVTLLVRYFQTGEAKFRRAAMKHVEAIGRWEYWSWITWQQNNADPMAIFDLSYGENSATLAIAYDWLHGELSTAEKRMMLGIAQRRAFGPFLHHTKSLEPGKHAWWYHDASCNWNSVCAGGAGMLALAMMEDAPEAATVLERADASMVPFMRSLAASCGAWPEGIGYWNYGMRYAFMYLLSHERATARRHPLLRQPATRATLAFPLDFSPNNVPCSFGDSNVWVPLPFHLAAAEQLGDRVTLGELLRRCEAIGWPYHAWPNAAEAMVLCPDSREIQRNARRGEEPAPRRNVARLYKGQDWAVLADRMPRPRFYMAIRGGTTEVSAGHHDLLSFHAVVRDEAMLTNITASEYLDSTFGPRRFELFETAAPSKNTIFINGVGIGSQATVKTTPVGVGGLNGFRMDASNCFGKMRDGPVAKFIGRLFLFLPDAGDAGGGALVIDRIELPHVGRTESRLHTRAKVTRLGDSAELKGKKRRLTIAYACDVPAALHEADDALTTPVGDPPTMLRWVTSKLHESVTMATLLWPEDAAASVKVTSPRGRIRVTVRVRGKLFRVQLSSRLRPT